MSGDGAPMVECAPAIVWVKDADRILVVDSDGKRSWALCGAEAVIWDLLTLGYGLDGIARFVSVLLAVSHKEAKATVLATVLNWEKAGIVRAAGRNGHG